MTNISNLKRQHEEVGKIVEYIKKQIFNNYAEDNAGELAKNISILAGKLKIHLREEDRSLYPSLLDSNSDELRKFGKTYYDEMEGIFEAFNSYKEKYNTRTKILNNISDFETETNYIIDALESRINKEDAHLYPLIENM